MNVFCTCHLRGGPAMCGVHGLMGPVPPKYENTANQRYLKLEKENKALEARVSVLEDALDEIAKIALQALEQMPKKPQASHVQV